jgi:U3 small nucleolar RNA-associated protein 14
MRKQEELERKANYQIVKKDVNKWQEIIKKNREAPVRDFVEKKTDQQFRM